MQRLESRHCIPETAVITVLLGMAFRRNAFPVTRGSQFDGCAPSTDVPVRRIASWTDGKTAGAGGSDLVLIDLEQVPGASAIGARDAMVASLSADTIRRRREP